LFNTFCVSFVNILESTFIDQAFITEVIYCFNKLCICEYFEIIFDTSKFSYPCVYLSVLAVACNIRSPRYYKIIHSHTIKLSSVKKTHSDEETNSFGRPPSPVVETHNSFGNSDDLQATHSLAKKNIM